MCVCDCACVSVCVPADNTYVLGLNSSIGQPVSINLNK